MVLLMMKSVWPLLIESALILLQTVPTHIEVDTLKKKLLVSSAKNKLEVFANDFELFKNKSEKQRP
jgi:Co/Zn/Cd efflux system component